MKFGGDAGRKGEVGDSRDEMRELAEAVSLYRSAMQHVAEKQAAGSAGSFTASMAAEREPAKTAKMRLLLVPALAAALAAAVLAPAVSHLHRSAAVTRAAVHAAGGVPAQTVASVDDTQLMNQIDSEVSEDVPDALQPLADLSEEPAAGTTSTTRSEK
jgi:hypothetical protein